MAGRRNLVRRCHQDGWGNKARIQAIRGSETSHTPSRLPGSRILHGEGGPPPQLDGSQYREEAARQQQELGKEWED